MANQPGFFPSEAADVTLFNRPTWHHLQKKKREWADLVRNYVLHHPKGTSSKKKEYLDSSRIAKKNQKPGGCLCLFIFQINALSKKKLPNKLQKLWWMNLCRRELRRETSFGRYIKLYLVSIWLSNILTYIDLVYIRPCLVCKKFCKIFQIPHHIESLDTCMKY